MNICTFCGEKTEKSFCPKDGFPTISEEIYNKRKKDKLIGKIIQDKYKIIEIIGRGGMGKVYRAIQINVKKWVAIKMMARDLSSNKIMIKRFYREVMAASRLNHPGSVTIHDFGQTEDGELFIVMEYIDGVTLADYIENFAPLSPSLTSEVAAQIAGVLDTAHKMEIYHRDLKPENIFLVSIPGQGVGVKIVDFGIAKISIGTDQSGVTKSGMIMGTPPYMSPEQCKALQIDGRADLYSLGVIMYEMLTGSLPFTGETPIEVIMKHINEPFPIHNLRGVGTVYENLVSIIKDLTQKDVSKRPKTGHEVFRRIKSVPYIVDLDDYNSKIKAILNKKKQKKRLSSDTGDFSDGGVEKTEVADGPPDAVKDQIKENVVNEIDLEDNFGEGDSDSISKSLIAGTKRKGVVIAVIAVIFLAGVFILVKVSGKKSNHNQTSGSAAFIKKGLNSDKNKVLSVNNGDKNKKADVIFASQKAGDTIAGGGGAEVISKADVLTESKKEVSSHDSVKTGPHSGARQVKKEVKKIDFLLESVPSGAEVIDYFTKKSLGKTPLRVGISESNSKIKLLIRRKGYRPLLFTSSFKEISSLKHKKKRVVLKKKRKIHKVKAVKSKKKKIKDPLEDY